MSIKAFFAKVETKKTARSEDDGPKREEAKDDEVKGEDDGAKRQKTEDASDLVWGLRREEVAR